MTDDNGAGLRALFHGLCLFWEIDVRAAEDPGDPSDFSLPVIGLWPAYVVIVPEPAARQVEIESLLQYGNVVIVLDAWDLNNLRVSAGREGAVEWLRLWTATGETHAASERRRLGIVS